jgi:hypothetical protein
VGVFEDADLAGDVDVVRGIGQARLQQRRGGGGEGPGAVGQHGDVGQGRARALGAEYPALQAQHAAQRLHGGGIAPAQQRAQALASGLLGQQAAGVAVGAVDHPVGLAHSGPRTGNGEGSPGF